jgi:hypothetical protein
VGWELSGGGVSAEKTKKTALLLPCLREEEELS